MNAFMYRHLPRLIAYAIGFPLSYLGFSWLIPVSQFTDNDPLLLCLVVLGAMAFLDFISEVTRKEE